MQGDVMEHGLDSAFRQFANQAGALLQRIEQDVIHVRVVRAVFRNARTPQDALFFQGFQRAVVHIPPLQSFPVDLLPVFKLSVQIGGCHLSGQVG